jgi:two-component system chemotaxis response regulator CheB
MKPVRVLIVDDSATIRELLGSVLSRDPEIEVIGSAPEPAVARQMIKELNPDVITLDVEMPNMNGLEFLEKIMRLRPMPIVMVSTLTSRGAEATLAALELGAVDYYAKPTDNVSTILGEDASELAAKVKAAARARVNGRRRAPQASAKNPATASYKPGKKKIVAIGASTGGVEALIEVLSHFPENCPPTVITQHMPAQFTATFAQRLDRLCRPRVAEATEGAVLTTGQVYVAPGGKAHLEVCAGVPPRCKLARTDAVGGHRPSVDVLFNSVAQAAGRNGVGVILTGMGGDGAAGLKSMREKGASTIGQDDASSLIYGMPRVAFEIGAVQRQLPLDKIGAEILRLCEAQG